MSIFMILFEGELGKELVEFYKWSTIGLSILLFQEKRSITFLKAFGYFAFSSFVMIIMQQLFSENELIRSISKLYASPELIENNFVPGYVRSTGFNEGPGHVGVLITFTLLLSYLLKKWRVKLPFSLKSITLLSATSAFFAASKGVIPVLFLLNTKFILLTGLIIFVIFLNVYSLDDLYYLERLSSSASGEARVGIWSELIHNSIAYPHTVLFGTPRIGHVGTISVFDSDWVYIYYTKGLIGILMIFLTLFLLVIKFNSSFASAIFTLLVLFLIGFANPAVTDIKFGLIYFQLLLSLQKIFNNKNIKGFQKV